MVTLDAALAFVCGVNPLLMSGLTTMGKQVTAASFQFKAGGFTSR